MNMAVLERDYRIDGIKWLLIVLVTFGHVIEPALSNPIANKLYSIIYIFHMPYLSLSVVIMQMLRIKKN